MLDRDRHYVAALGGLAAALCISGAPLAAQEKSPKNAAAFNVENSERERAPKDAQHGEPQPAAASAVANDAGDEQGSNGQSEVQKSWWQRVWASPGDTFNGVIAVCTVILAFIGLWQAAIARGAARRQLRAYCGPSNFKLSMPRLNDPKFKAPDPPPTNYIVTNFIIASVRNFGLTPAFDVTVQVNWQTFEPFGVRIPIGFEFPDQREDTFFANKHIVDPGEEFPAIIPEVERDIQLFRDAKAKKVSLYLYGTINYRDAFGRRWRRTFCVAWEPWNNPGELQFVPVHTHSGETRA